MPRSARRASHAGSWYESDGRKLGRQIEAWLEAAPQRPPNTPPPRAVIAPHAGHRYCGHVMAAAYAAIDPSTIARVFVLGPSHHVYGRRCWLSSAAEYETPFGPLAVDQAVYAELRATGAFDAMTPEQDEAEHSLELHLPFIARAMGPKPFALVPIMVGALAPDAEARYAALLAPYLDDPANFFVVSSDFCHWGRRFGYTYYDKARGAIWESVRWLDELGMAAIERPARGRNGSGGVSGSGGSGGGANGGSGDGNGDDGDEGAALPAAAAFAAYLKEYRNTICGRHPIGVLLAMLAAARTDLTVKFTAYDQSSRCEGPGDSSVSYAAALVTPAS